ncbi:7025_t:CDS:2, partial [Paraglomus occultum]
ARPAFYSSMPPPFPSDNAMVDGGLLLIARLHQLTRKAAQEADDSGFRIGVKKGAECNQNW